MPKILLIADSDALWTKRAVEYLLLPAGYEIVIFPIWGHKGQFDNFYREHGVTVYRDPHRLPVIRHIPRVRMWARIALNARDLAKYGPFDVVHNLHFFCNNQHFLYIFSPYSLPFFCTKKYYTFPVQYFSPVLSLFCFYLAHLFTHSTYASSVFFQ